MLFGSVRFCIIRDTCSWSNLPRVASGLRSWSSVCAPVNNTKSSVNDLALNSVVKVFCCSTESSVLQPWQKRLPDQNWGSGFVIAKNKILTNAHVVADHTFVQVRKHGSPAKYKAEVEAVGHECDLAVLKIKNKKFWKDMKSLDLGDIPCLQQEVFVVGYPRVTRYSHSGAKLLTIQVDAAINGGNSGGPVFTEENKVVGVAFQGLSSSQSTGYIIPTPIVNYFLNGINENGKFCGFCSLGLTCQHAENSEIRNYFKMKRRMTGIVIKKINPLSGSYNILKKDVVVLSVGGVSVGNDETVVFRKKDRINFSHLVSMKKPGETVSVKVSRDGKKNQFNITVDPVEPLVPLYQFDKASSYYVFGGFLFLPLNKPYMAAAYISESLLEIMPKKAGEQIVILSQVLMDDISKGYAKFEDFQVKKVNGVQVENLKHLCKLIEECCTEHLRLDLVGDNFIIVNHKSAKNATSKILKRYGIPSPMSTNLSI